MNKRKLKKGDRVTILNTNELAACYTNAKSAIFIEHLDEQNVAIKMNNGTLQEISTNYIKFKSSKPKTKPKPKVKRTPALKVGDRVKIVSCVEKQNLWYTKRIGKTDTIKGEGYKQFGFSKVKRWWELKNCPSDFSYAECDLKKIRKTKSKKEAKPNAKKKKTK